jgi:phosphate transport system substrate-binding protein
MKALLGKLLNVIWIGLQMAVLSGAVFFCVMAFNLFFWFPSGTEYMILLPLTILYFSVLLWDRLIFSKFRPYHVKMFFGGIVLYLLTVAGIETSYYLDSKVERVYDGVDITEYMPFSTAIPVLGETSTLKLEKDLPILDGALALYPVYSAFATAVYPKKDYYLYPNFRGNAFYDGTREKPKETHEVHFTNTVKAFERLLNNEIDIYFMGEISEAQRKEARKRGVELEFTPIATDAFVFL